MPDGNIKLSVELNIQNALKSAEQFKTAIDNAFKNKDVGGLDQGIKKIGEQLINASNQVTDYANQLKSLQSTMQSLASQAQSGKSVTGASEQYAQAIKDIETYENKIKELQSILAENAKNASQPSAIAPLPMSADEIAQTENQIVEFQGKIAELRSSMSTMESDGSAFPQITQAIQETTQAMSGTISQAQGLTEQFQNIQNVPTFQDLIQGEEEVSQGAQQAAQSVEQLAQAEQQVASSAPVSGDLGLGDTTSQAEKANYTYQELMATLQRLKEEKKAVDSGQVQMDDQGVINLTRELNEAQSAVDSYKAKIAEASQHSTSFGQKAGMIGASIQTGVSKFKEFGEAASSAFQKVSKGVGTALSGIKNLMSSVGSKLTSAFKKMKGASDNAFSAQNMKRGLTTILKYGFGVRSLYFAFRKLRNALKEGFQNLAQYESKTGAASKGIKTVNEAITNLKTSLLYLKNAWASAFAPIVNAVMPMLTGLIDKMAQVGNAVAKFAGALTGQKTVLNAVKVNAGDYAKSLDKTSKKAGNAAKKQKKLNDRLADFDDLHVLGKDQDTGSGGGGGAGGATTDQPDPKTMFKPVEAISNLADMIKDAWAKADFTNVGKLVRDKIVDALAKIDWGTIKDTAFKVGKSIATFLNGALSDPAIWARLGVTVAEGLNTITQAIAGFLQNNKVDFGGGFATLINNFFGTIDWATVNKNITDFGSQLTDNINSFFSTLNMDKISLDIGGLAKSVTTALVNMATGIDWDKIAGAFTELGDAILKGMEEGFKQSDNPLMQSIGDLIGSFREALGTLLPVIQQIFNAVSPIIQAILPVLSSVLPQVATIIADIANLLVPLITSIIQTLMPILEKIINAILPVIHTLLTALQPVIQVFTDQILPIIADLFDAIMPVFESILNCVMDILQPIIELLAPLLQLVGEILKPIIALLKPIFSALKQLFDITGAILKPILSLLKPLTELLSAILRPLNNVIEVIANFIASKLAPAFEFVTNLIKTVVNPIFKALSLAISAVTDVFNNFGKVVSLVFEGIKAAFKAVWEFIKKTINSILGGIEALANGVIKGMNFVIKALNKLSFDVPDWIPVIGGKKFGFNLKELQTISLPRLAEGAVIPPNKEFMAVLGDQSHGTNIEAPLDTIKQAVAEVMANNGSAEMIQLLQQLIAVVESKNLVIGDTAIGQANARYTNQQRIIRGTSF